MGAERKRLELLVFVPEILRLPPVFIPKRRRKGSSKWLDG